MKELEKEVQPRPARIGVHVQNKMEFESTGSQRMNAPKKMDVEYEEGRKIEEQYYWSESIFIDILVTLL